MRKASGLFIIIVYIWNEFVFRLFWPTLNIVEEKIITNVRFIIFRSSIYFSGFLVRIQDYYERRLTERTYHHWKQALTRKILVQRNKYRLEQLQEQILMRWAFEGWKSCEKRN